MNGQIVFFDKLVRPDGVEQFVFGQGFSAIFDQNRQQFEGFRIERERRAVFCEQAFFGVESEFTKDKTFSYTFLSLGEIRKN